MENKREKVLISNMSNSKVLVNSQELHFRREWLPNGATVKVDKDILDDLMYDQGFKYLVDTGILFIEDLELKKELGIEPQEAEEPVNIIKLDEKKMQQLLTVTSPKGFQDTLQKLSKDQLHMLADYAIEKKLVDYEKCEIIRKACGRDIINTIRLAKED